MTFQIKKKLLQLSCAIAALAVAGFSQPAYALDPGEFVQKLEQSAEANGASFSFENKQEVSGGIVLRKVEISDKQNNSTSTIGELFFGNPQTEGEDGVRFDALEASDYTHKRTADGETQILTAAKLEAAGVFLPNVADRTNPLWPAKMDSLEITDLEFSNGDKSRPTTIRSAGLAVTGLEGLGEDKLLMKTFELQPATGSIDADGNKLAIGFEGISVTDLERFSERGLDVGFMQVGSLTIVGKDKEGRDIDLKFDGGSISNLYVADPTLEDRPIISEKPINATMNELNVKLDGKEFIGWKKGGGTYTYDPDSTTGTGTFLVDNLFIDLSAAPENAGNRQGMERIKELGYERLGMNVNGAGSWNTTSGVVTVDDYRFEFIDAGALEMNMKVSGYTPQVARSINKIASEARFEKDPEKAQLNNMQMLAALAGLAIQEMRISVEDASLLNKILNLQAKKLGKEPQEIAAIVGPMASIMLAPYQVPEFAASVSAAVSTFMQGNKTITASVKPDGGLVVTEMIALGSGIQAGKVQPAEIIDRLKLEVTAK